MGSLTAGRSTVVEHDETTTTARDSAASADSGNDPPRRRGRFLSRDAIVDSALRLVTTEGIEKLTIRRIAADLDAAPMALYRHYPDKRSLEIAMLERMAKGMPPVPVEGEPREQIVVSAIAAHDYLHSHGWIVPFLREGGFVPDDLEYLDHQLAMFMRLGLSRAEAIGAHTAIWWLVLGHLAAIDGSPAVDAADAALPADGPIKGRDHWAGFDAEAVFRLALTALVDGLLAAGGGGPADSPAT